MCNMTTKRKRRAKLRHQQGDLVKAWLENKGLEQTEDYVRRGRALQSWTLPALTERWVAAFRKWTADWNDKSDEGVRADIEAEFRLRNIELPMSLVKSEVEALKAAATKSFERLVANPRRFDEVEEDLQADLRDFRISNEKNKS